MGIIANVYRSDYDCTLNGWSSLFNKVTVVNAEGPFDPTDDCPAVMIVRHSTMNSLHAISVADKLNNRQTMMGGNFLHSSDSRFGKLCQKLLEEGGANPVRGWIHTGAIAIHDRVEW